MKEVVILSKKQKYYAKGESVLVKNADEMVKKGKATRPKIAAKKKAVVKKTESTK